MSLALSLAACSSSGQNPDAGNPPPDVPGDVADEALADVPAVEDVPVAPRDTGPVCPAPSTPMAFQRNAAARHPQDDTLRMNHLQAKASHNSYHIQPRFEVAEWAYTHAPLGEQLANQGVRGVELDVYWNEGCGRFEVYHIRNFDDVTTCRVFTDCLAALRGFSATHPGHHPIFVQIEPKDDDATFTEARLAALEAEVLTVFDRAWIVTPDEVRGASQTLAAGIADHGWPTLGAARGRFWFSIDNASAPRNVYTHGGRDLNGRLMFVNSALDAPYAGVMILNDPVRDAATIATALARGYIVRTRADADMAGAPVVDRSQRQAALSSGAQIVSTDFPVMVEGNDYFVTIPGGTPSRCSPVTALASCTSAAIEDPARLAP